MPLAGKHKVSYANNLLAKVLTLFRGSVTKNAMK